MSNNSTHTGSSGSPDQPHNLANAGASSDEGDHAHASHASGGNKLVYETLMAMSSSQAMREAGLGEDFAKQMARNCQKFESLPVSTQHKIRDQLAGQAYALSNLETERQHSAERGHALARWLQGVNLLLAMHGRWG